MTGKKSEARDALAALAIKSLVGQVVLLAFPLYVEHDLSLGTGGAVVLLAPGVAGVALGILWGAFVTRESAARAMRRRSTARAGGATPPSPWRPAP